MRPSPTERPGQRYQRGSFTVEFALVVPILIAILFGVIDAGRFIATRTMLSQAAAAAARAACLSSTTGSSDLTQAANDAAPALTGLSASAACAGACAYPVAIGATVEVSVTYTFVASFFRSFQRSMTNSSLITCS